MPIGASYKEVAFGRRLLELVVAHRVICADPLIRFASPSPNWNCSNRKLVARMQGWTIYPAIGGKSVHSVHGKE